MPIITVQCAAMDKETKKQFIKEITVKASEVTKIREEAFTIVIQETGSDNIGLGGKMLSEVMK